MAEPINVHAGRKPLDDMPDRLIECACGALVLVGSDKRRYNAQQLASGIVLRRGAHYCPPRGAA